MAMEVTDSTFQAEVLDATGVVVVDFWASWCGPCQTMLPVIEAAAEELSDVKFVKCNIDENSEVTMKYGIMSIPAFKIFKDGEIIGEMMGAMNKDEFVAKIKEQM